MDSTPLRSLRGSRRKFLPFPLLVFLVMALVSAPASAKVVPGPPTGPYMGVILPSQSVVHGYDNGAPGMPCSRQTVHYEVTLHHQPASDVLRLTVQGQSVVSLKGEAKIAFEDQDCTAFLISLFGESVAVASPYVLTVSVAVPEIP